MPRFQAFTTETRTRVHEVEAKTAAEAKRKIEADIVGTTVKIGTPGSTRPLALRKVGS